MQDFLNFQESCKILQQINFLSPRVFQTRNCRGGGLALPRQELEQKVAKNSLLYHHFSCSFLEVVFRNLWDTGEQKSIKRFPCSRGHSDLVHPPYVQQYALQILNLGSVGSQTLERARKTSWYNLLTSYMPSPIPNQCFDVIAYPWRLDMVMSPRRFDITGWFSFMSFELFYPSWAKIHIWRKYSNIHGKLNFL